ncbi:MAG: DUF2273 domain-containing protein [Candidatus Acetothermia bacterium]|jgi:uncharacterized membrane protein|nr:DUF2273 domain-containing protein [Candidatus Acetothermia bacterium]MDH7505816.1 DUF2273 domain-containing protein [Candidatus Acetothermia bacterium]
MKKVWGAISGFVVSILILWPGFGWRLLIIAILVLIGYTVGRYLEAGEETRERIRELLSTLFR